MSLLDSREKDKAINIRIISSGSIEGRPVWL
jgi:hypothetical protein